MLCDRCGGVESDALTLVGGFRAHLCVGCENEWSLKMVGSEAYREVIVTKADTDCYLALAEAGVKLDNMELRRLRWAEQVALKVILELGAQFVRGSDG